MITGKLNETAKELQEQLITQETEAMIVSLKIEQIRRKLIPICDHPNPADWEWEHDNGYGRQTMLMGKRCAFCFKVDRWNNNVWT